MKLTLSTIYGKFDYVETDLSRGSSCRQCCMFGCNKCDLLDCDRYDTAQIHYHLKRHVK